MVLRAFAAHPTYKKSEEVRLAGELLASRFFRTDSYPDRRAPGFWTSFSFPFWFTDLLSSLDSLSQIGFTKENFQVSTGLKRFKDKEQEDGLWRPETRIMAKEYDRDFWISLAICRVFKRFFSS